jgi:hypothetical protein
MIISKQFSHHKYEHLIGLIRHGEFYSKEIDQLCRQAINRPISEKGFFDVLEKQKRAKTIDSQNCCICIDQIVVRIIQAIKENTSCRSKFQSKDKCSFKK